LGTVLVEGVSRAPDRMIDAPAAVDVVRPATAEPVSITGQVPLALARVPGLDVTQSGMSDFNVNARGFNTNLSHKMLVLQDGRELATALVIRQTWGALAEPLEDLGRIEVIRGPGSALYGANAYNGVINITTPPARDVVGTKLTLGGGELGTRHARPVGHRLRVRAGGLPRGQSLHSHVRGRRGARGKPGLHGRHRTHPSPQARAPLGAPRVGRRGERRLRLVFGSRVAAGSG